MRRFHRVPPWLLVLVVVALVSGACASVPTDRVLYTTIDSATDAVQSAVRAFSDLYQKGQFKAADRTEVLDAYAKYQAVAEEARKLSQGATVLNPDVSKLISDGVADCLAVIRKFTGGK